MLFDFHVHSVYSPDSYLRPETIIKKYTKKGFSGIAITDHNSILGALKTKSLTNNNLLIIIGEEIKIENGEIIGLFLNEKIKSKTFHEIKDEIKGQGGLIALPHPFKSNKFDPELFAKEVDLIEGLNARIRKDLNIKACDLARNFGLPIIAGSDAHTSFEIGNVQNNLPIDDLNTEEIRKALTKGLNMPAGSESPGYIRLLSQGLGKYKRSGLCGITKSIYKKTKKGS